MRTPVVLTWVAAAALTLTGCAAQNQAPRLHAPAAIDEAPFHYKAHIVIAPGPMCPAYPARLPVIERKCPVSHPYYRDAKTLVVGPAYGTELDVTLKARCPALQGKATVTFVQIPATGKYYIGSRPLTRHCQIVLDPGDYQLCLCVMGNPVKIAELELHADTDYFACVGET